MGIVENLITDDANKNLGNSGDGRNSTTVVQPTTTLQSSTTLPELTYKDILQLDVDPVAQSKEICKSLSNSIDKQQISTTKYMNLLKSVESSAYRGQEFLNSQSWTINDQEGTFTFGLETIAAKQLSTVTMTPPNRTMSMNFLLDSLTTCDLSISYSEALAQSASVNNSVAAIRAKVQNLPWYPEGFGVFSSGVAYKWLDRGEYNCSYGDHCWGMTVVTQSGCPNSLYVEITILDDSGTNIGYTNDVANGVRAGDKVKLVFEDFTPGARTARLAEISCY